MKATLLIGGMRLGMDGGRGVELTMGLQGMSQFATEGGGCDAHLTTDADITIGDCRWLADFEVCGGRRRCHFGRDSVGQFVYDFGQGERLLCQADGREMAISAIADGGEALLRYALWAAYGMAGLESGRVPVHASAVVWGDEVVACLGESGTGKSTHTRMWTETIDGSYLLNDDSPIVTVEGDEVWAYGSPWSGKMPCFRQERHRLAALVRICRDSENWMEHLRPLRAVAAFQPSCPPCMMKDGELAERLTEYVCRVVERTQTYALHCRPDADAARTAQREIFAQDESRPRQ